MPTDTSEPETPGHHVNLLLVAAVAGVIALVASCVGIGFGIAGLRSGDKANDRIVVLEDARNTSREIVCAQANDQAARQRAGAIALPVATLTFLATRGGTTELDAEDASGIDHLVTSLQPQVWGWYPDRDCTAGGLTRYYDGDDTTDPYLPAPATEDQ